MAIYYRSDQERKVYKISQDPDGIWLYWVSAYKLEDGSFVYGRGRNRMESVDKAINVCGIMCVKATEEEYYDTLKSVFKSNQFGSEKLENLKKT